MLECYIRPSGPHQENLDKIKLNWEFVWRNKSNWMMLSVECSPKTRYKIDRPILMWRNTFNVVCLALVLAVPLELDHCRKVVIRFTGWCSSRRGVYEKISEERILTECELGNRDRESLLLPKSNQVELWWRREINGPWLSPQIVFLFLASSSCSKDQITSKFWKMRNREDIWYER